MAPRSSQDEASEAPEKDPGHDEFFESLTKFAEHRGINVDFNSRVNGKHIDLHKLWNVVTSKGGYDAISKEKLAWRKVGVEFELGNANAAAYAFALKTTYYKNLAAYEIKTLWHKEPPPMEILEKLTAKGGDILSRTVENFQPPNRSSLVNGDSDSGEDAKTPKEEKMDIDDPGSGGGRSTRGLRQAPPPRQLFQPDLSSSRQTRHSSGHLQSPQPAAGSHAGYNYASSNPNSASFAISNYEPRPPMPLTLRPVPTPSSNPAQFIQNQQRAREARKLELGLVSPTIKGMMQPGAGFDGPNIYVRTLQGLRSQVAEEQDYALHHLVKISHERGDKYKFDAFPNLAEGLIEYVLGISSLFYDVKWKISYSGDEHGINVLDGIRGTPDILQKIRCLKRVDTPDEMESEEFGRKLTKILEAGLTIRNLGLLEDNAIYLSDMPQLRDFLSIALNLPPLPVVTELKHYALEVAEQVTKYWRMDESDPLYRSLLGQVNAGHDRGAIITALRALSRISFNHDDVINYLKGVPVSVIRRICEWVLLDDEELVHACLDFLYFYTAVPENIVFLLSNSNEYPISFLFSQLSRILQFHATTSHLRNTISKEIPIVPATEIPEIPRDLLDQFLKCDEPERSNHWLRAVYEEDEASHITQIALWQAYQLRFGEYQTERTGLLPAAEFIKNVSTIFAGANAQVVNGATQKFIIKGIRPRHAPMDPKGRVYSRCLWKAPGSSPCGEFLLKPKNMWDHIIYQHMGVDRKSDGLWDLESTSRASQLPPDCFWADCRHFSRRDRSAPTAYDLGMHIKTHLPDQTKDAVHRQKHNRTPANQSVFPTRQANSHRVMTKVPNVDPEHGREEKSFFHRYETTSGDDVGNAIGLPWGAVVVLRNLARNIPKAAALHQPENKDAVAREAIERLFGPLKDRLLYVMAYNKPLAGFVTEVLGFLEKGSGGTF